MSARNLTPGPREADLYRLLANVRAIEGHRGNLILVDGSFAECEARLIGRRVARMFRITTKTRIGTTGWLNQKVALQWARDQDAAAVRS